MTRSETAKLLAFCAAYDQRTIGEADVLAWHEALDDIGYDDAQCAVVAHYRESAERVKVADIRKRVKTAREDVLSRALPRGHGMPPNDEYREARQRLSRRPA